MKKRILSLFLAVLMLASLLPTAALADGAVSFPALQSSDLFDFSWITNTYSKVKNDIKSIAWIDIFDTASETVSSSEQAFPGSQSTVTLTAPEVSYKKLSSLQKYKTEYQWYVCSDAQGNNAQPIDGATGDTLTVALTQGSEYYSCRATVYRVLSLVNLKTDKIARHIYTLRQSMLPVIYVNTDSGSPVSSREEWVGADITITGCDKEKYNLKTTDIKIKGRGNSSWMGAGAKNSYTIKFDSKENLFGIGKDKKWALVANYFDKSLMRNWLAHKMDTEIFDYGKFDITQIPVDLYVNNEYVGNYYLTSTIKLGSKRIDVQDISELEEDVNGDGVIDLYDGGFVIEADARKDASHYFSGKHTGIWFCLSDPDLDDEAEYNDAIFTHIQSIVQNVEDVLYSNHFADPETGYASVLDVDSFIDYYLIEEIAKNNDACFYTSVHMYYDPADGLIHMAPVWDFDIGYGNINYNGCDDYHGLWCNAAWFGRLMNDPVFVEKLVNRWNETKDQVSYMVNHDIQQQADKLSVSAELNFAKWPILGVYTWPAPAGYESRTTYQSEVDYLINWTNSRIDWLDGYLNSLV